LRAWAREEGRMSEARLVCRVCDGVFSEHQVRLKSVDPQEDQVQCPNCGSSRMEPYVFAPTPRRRTRSRGKKRAPSRGLHEGPYS
jgi:hypothetical protein